MYLIILSFYNILTIWTINLLPPNLQFTIALLFDHNVKIHMPIKLYNYSLLND